MTDLNTHTHTHLDVRQNGSRPRPVGEPAPTMLGEGLAKGVPVWRSNAMSNAAERPATEPAPTITAGHDSGERVWTVRTGANGMKHSRKTEDIVPYERPISDPAPTVDGKVGGAWKVAPEGEHNDAHRVTGQQRVAGDSEQRDPRTLDEPSYTLRANAGGGSNGVGRSGGVQWVTERPATAVQGDPRISPPGFRGGRREYESLSSDESPKRSGDNAVRVSVEEAAILQSFPPDHPWQGSRTAQFRQIGNAVPPGLAKAILTALLEAA